MDAFQKAYPEFGYVFRGFELDIYSKDIEGIEDLKDRLRRDLSKIGNKVPSSEAVRALIDADEIGSRNLREFVLEEIQENLSLRRIVQVTPPGPSGPP